MENFKKYKILIVDDIPKNIELAANILRTKDYNITFAKSGFLALEKVKSIDFDLILLDVMMPLMDGFEVCKLLKSDPSTKNIPVIFLTAKSETENIVKGFELGAVDYVTKPFKTEELIARVMMHLGIKSKLEEKEQIEQELLKNKEQLQNLLTKLQETKISEKDKSNVIEQVNQGEIREKELEKKKIELDNVTLFYELRSQLDILIKDRNPVARMEIKQVKEMISNLFIDKNNYDFHRELKRSFPKLTFDDLRLCSYLRQRFLNIEIAEFLETSPEAVYTRKSRLRQKLELDNGQEIADFLANFNS
jgi:DNA-binding response OmpR family regulator